MAELNLDNPSGKVNTMAIRGGPLNNPAFVHTSTERKGRSVMPQKFEFNANMPKFAQMNKAFLTGFCEKCAEYGISPFVLMSKKSYRP
jgi:hypothetical protein